MPVLDYDQLAALAAVVRTGSFEAAAREIHVTASAVSQRLKLLEERVGAVLVVRGQPCVATPAGARLCRHSEEVGLLERGLWNDIGPRADRRPAVLRVAVNADSLATWFIEAMAAVDGLLFELVLDDQDHSAEWLRRGEVSAAVSGQGRAVQGCDRRPLGEFRYVATASPGFVARWFAQGVDEAALNVAPSLRFNTKDELQAQWARSVFGTAPLMPCHRLPSTHAFVDGTLAGLGWGMNPISLVAPHLQGGRLVEIVPGTALDVPLFWHWSRTSAPALSDVTRAVLKAGAAHLVRPGASR